MHASPPPAPRDPVPARRCRSTRGVVRALGGLSAALAVLLTVGHRGQARQPLDPQALIPFDAAVRTGTLPNGVTFYVRQNVRPAGRVLLRLAVKAGSLDEADDEQGLAHFLEHMAFNGSAHFKPGEFISYFESIGARMGPHVNAYTGFEETVYMLDLPSDEPGIVARGLTALADIAGGLTIGPEQVERSAASSSRSGEAASALRLVSAIGRYRCCTTGRDTPSASRSASRT